MSERRGGKYELSQGIEYKAFVSKVLWCMFSGKGEPIMQVVDLCLLYTSDAADE